MSHTSDFGSRTAGEYGDHRHQEV